MDATPNTLNYLIGGYVFFTVFMSVYIISLVSRWNNLTREQEMLNEMEKSEVMK